MKTLYIEPGCLEQGFENGATVPDNVTLALLPPYSPELNPVERVWL